MGMPSTLDRVDGLRERVAELWVEGLTNKAIAETVHSEFAEIEDVPVKNTIINWRKDDVVENKIHALMRERIGRIVRKTDAVIAKALDDGDMTVDEAIKIRKEFVPERDAFTDEKQDASKIDEDLFGMMEEDPEFAEKLMGDLDGDAGD
jgi:hypothetical protein